MSLAVEFDLQKGGGQAGGDVMLKTDANAPFDCVGAPTTAGSATMTALPFDHDEDGDGCTDWYELGENPELGGLNDPFNPNDCSVQLTPDGLYEISHGFANGYRRCMGAVNTGLSMDVYCYTDSTSHQVNPEAYPGWDGDGLPGAPPPGPDITGGGDFPNLVYGDVNGTHATFQGSLNGGTLTFTGCFVDNDRGDALNYVGVTWAWDVQTGAGTSKMATSQFSCPSSSGAPALPLQAMKLATTQQMNDCYVVAGVCPFADNDGDGVPDHRELRDDTACGLRDPFNPNDYYDVSIPRDGVIDLGNDITGVINNYAPGGYAPGSPAIYGPGTLENYDRPAPMLGGAGGWNRGSPDGVIDLGNAQLGAINQYNPGGCSGP